MDPEPDDEGFINEDASRWSIRSSRKRKLLQVVDFNEPAMESKSVGMKK